MRFIPTSVHGVLDYLMGGLLIATPWLFGFADDAGGAAMWVPIVLGAGAILYSLFTDYELGVVRKLPMPIHLWLDLASGLTLAVAPFLFGYVEEGANVWLTFLVLGLLEIGASLTTRTHPAAARPSAAALPGHARGA